MTNNHRKIFIFVITVCLFSVAGLSADTGADSLWLKTVELADVNRGWIAGETEILLEFLNSKGIASKTMRMSGTAELTESNVIKREVTGSEEFQKMKSQQNDNSEGPGFLRQQENYNPFLPEVQRNISITHLDNSEVFKGVVCAVYDISGIGEDGEKYTAKAWIDEQTGVPLRLQVTLVTLPDNVRSMKIDMLFSSTDNLDVYPETSIMEMTAVKFFIFKQRLRWNMRFDNYFRIPEEQ